MGSRGAFVNVNKNDFTFVSGGQNYFSLGSVSDDSNIKVLVQQKGSVKAPEYSHTEGRIYAIVQKGKLKHLAFYDENHKQSVSIDLMHKHNGIIPHKHYYLNHDKNSGGIKISEKEATLINKIKKEFNLK